MSFLPLRAYSRAIAGRVPLLGLLLLSLVMAASAKLNCTTPDFPANEITQPVDHFDLQNADTFLQRFWQQSRWWKARPQQERQFVFLRINTFSEPRSDMESSTVALWAKELGALYFEIEPRYSPCSSPAKDYATRDLRYCSVEQILADFVNFIANQTKTLNLLPSTRWVVVGELFDGAYATWLRSKPHLTFGSISVSPHLYGVLEYPGYDEAYQNFLGSTCAGDVHNVMTALSEFIRDNPANASYAYQESVGCTAPLPDSEFLYVASTILLGSLDWGKAMICANLSKARGGTPQQQLVNLAALLKSINSLPCEAWDFARDTDTTIGDIYADFRPTYYLKCTQLGQFETPSDPAKTLLPRQRNLDWYLDVCQKLFANISETPAVAALNANYGGRNPDGCNMIFVASPNDPYEALGPDRQIIEGDQLRTANQVINLACNSPMSGLNLLGEPTSSDPSCLVGARQKIIATLRAWKEQPVTCRGQGGGGGGGGDDSGKLALVGTLAGIFGVGLGAVIGVVAFYYVSRYAYRKYLTAGWSKVN